MAMSEEERKERNRVCQRKRRAKKLYLGDMTREQALEITDLAFPFSEYITSEPKEFKYFNGDFGQWIDKAEETAFVKFRSLMPGYSHNIETIIVRFSPCLSIHVSIVDEKGHKLTLTAHNQYQIQQKFNYWKILPQLT